jgi:periplasmic divalent cation tolerance protein
MIVIFTTAPNEAEAEKLAKRLIEVKLAACIQILPKMKSFYFWKGDIQKDEEYLLLIKTLAEKFDEVSDFIKANHSYEVPEILSIKAESFSDEYFKWANESIFR